VVVRGEKLSKIWSWKESKVRVNGFRKCKMRVFVLLSENRQSGEVSCTWIGKRGEELREWKPGSGRGIFLIFWLEGLICGAESTGKEGGFEGKKNWGGVAFIGSWPNL